MANCECCGQRLSKNSPVTKTLDHWLATIPKEITHEHPVKTQDVLDAYNRWARSKGYEKYNLIKLGLELSRAIPGTIGKQMRIGKSRRARFYIFPKNPLAAFEDDLLDI